MSKAKAEYRLNQCMKHDMAGNYILDYKLVLEAWQELCSLAFEAGDEYRYGKIAYSRRNQKPNKQQFLDSLFKEPNQ